MLAREEWLGCQHNASPMVDIPRSTPVWAQYMYFWFLLRNLYVLCFKIYMYCKMTLVVPDIVLARQRSGNDFNRPWCFLKRNEKNSQIYCLLILLNWNWFTYLLYSYHLHDYMLLYTELIDFSMLSLWLFLSITEHMVAHTLTVFLFTS